MGPAGRAVQATLVGPLWVVRAPTEPSA
jgi:hypothetical protein